MTSFWVLSHKLKKCPPCQACITWHMKGRSGSATVHNEEELHQVLWDHGCNIVTDDDHEMRDWFVHVVADHNSPHVSVMIKLLCSNCTWCHISVWANAFNSCLILFLCQAICLHPDECWEDAGTWHMDSKGEQHSRTDTNLQWYDNKIEHKIWRNPYSLYGLKTFFTWTFLSAIAWTFMWYLSVFSAHRETCAFCFQGYCTDICCQ
jgi:hypothetical protein